MDRTMMRTSRRRRLGGAMALALMLAACARSPQGGGAGASGGSISYPSGPDRLVLSMAVKGGFIAPGVLLSRVPEFSLFGDGTLIVPGAEPAIYPAPALPFLERRTLTEAGIQAVLRRVVDAGLTTVPDMHGPVGIADAGTTVFTIDLAGVQRTVSVYALGSGASSDGLSTDQARERSALAAFATDLATVDRWAPKGSVGPATPYEAGGSRVYVGAYTGDTALRQRPVPWPGSMPLASFGEPTQVPGYTCGVVRGTDWTDTLLPAARRSNQLTPWTSDGARYALIFRPLLPDERAC
jgi:hypothetical protein